MESLKLELQPLEEQKFSLDAKAAQKTNLLVWGGLGRQSKKKLYGPFLWMGFNCLKATEPLWGGSLLFTTKFPEIPGTHLINLGRVKGWVDLGATQWFWTWTSGLGIQHVPEELVNFWGHVVKLIIVNFVINYSNSINNYCSNFK